MLFYCASVNVAGVIMDVVRTTMAFSALIKLSSLTIVVVVVVIVFALLVILATFVTRHPWSYLEKSN